MHPAHTPGQPHGGNDAPADASGDERHDEPHVTLHGIERDDARAAAAAAALTHVLSRPDSIRQRAQNAATISSAVAAALVIAGVSQLAGGKLSPTTPGGILLLVALAAWVIGVGMFVYAVAFIDKAQERPKGYQALVKSYEAYADKVRAQTKRAAMVSGFALFVTVVAMVVESFELKPPPDRRMHILLSDDAAADVDAVCPSATPPPDPVPPKLLVGHVAAGDMSKPLVRVKNVKLTRTKKRAEAETPRGRVCDAAGIDVLVPRSAIRAARNADP
jgi:hypothetical protein